MSKKLAPTPAQSTQHQSTQDQPGHFGAIAARQPGQLGKWQRICPALVMVALGLGGCAGAPSAAAPPKTEALPNKEVEPTRVPLSADERAALSGLKAHTNHLLGDIGERNEDKLWELAETADYLAGELESLGYAVERQGYETDRVAAQNLIVSVPGGDRGDQVLVVGTHYDSPASDLGRSSALSTAALLEVARLMRDAKLTRALRLAFFSMGESPHGRGEGCGAFHYARALQDEAKREPRPGLPEPVASEGLIQPIGAILFGRFDHLASGRVAQDWDPAGTLRSAALLPIAATESAFRVESLFAEGFDDEAIELRRAALPNGDCDGAAFLERQFPLVFLGAAADAAQAPNHQPGHGDEKSRAQHQVQVLTEFEYEDAARVVMRIRSGLGRLLGERPSNDGMVTMPNATVR